MTDDILPPYKPDKLPVKFTEFIKPIFTVVVWGTFFVYIFIYIFEKPTKPRFYENWGLYHHKLTMKEWDERFKSLWTTEDVQYVFGNPISEDIDQPKMSIFWKYKIPIKSEESGGITDKEVYIWFLIPHRDTNYIAIRMLDHRLFSH